MRRAKASHTPQKLVLQLHRQVGIAHQTLSQQVDAVPGVSRLVLVRRPFQPVGVLFLAGVLLQERVNLIGQLPIASPDLILAEQLRVSWCKSWLFAASSTYQAVNLMENGQGGALLRQRRVHEEAAMVREQVVPC